MTNTWDENNINKWKCWGDTKKAPNESRIRANDEEFSTEYNESYWSGRRKRRREKREKNEREMRKKEENERNRTGEFLRLNSERF